MSRSRKKPIVKGKGYRGYNRRYRRVCRAITYALVSKQRLQYPFDAYQDDVSYPDTRSVTNSYDVSDWQFWAWNDEQKVKYSRK